MHGVRGSGGRGEILFLAHRMPWPPDRGDKIRSYHELRAIAALAPVHVGCFADDERDESFAKEMAHVSQSQCVLRRPGARPLRALKGLAIGAPLSVSLYDHAAMHAYVRRTLAERPISAIFAFSGQMAQFVPRLPPPIRFIMDIGDIDSAKFAAYGAQKSGLLGWVNRREGKRWPAMNISSRNELMSPCSSALLKPIFFASLWIGTRAISARSKMASISTILIRLRNLRPCALVNAARGRCSSLPVKWTTGPI